jgi:hypothetical protein
MRLSPLTIALALLLAATSQAQTLYGFTRSSLGATTPTTLITIDPTTGALLTSIGPTGQGQLTATAIDPTSGQVYATHGGGGSWPVPGATGCLFGADLMTGAVSVIGCDPVFGGNDPIPGLAIDSLGSVFGLLNWWNSPGANQRINLIQINKTTGAITVIGATAFWAPPYGHGLEFGPGDTLYASNTSTPLGIVDIGTGGLTPVGTPSFVGFPFGGGAVTDMAYDSTTGTMYASVFDGGWTTALATVDVMTGTFTYIGNMPTYTNSITFGMPPAPTCVTTCGDCNEDTVVGSIIDALVAAQLAAALFTPTANQELCCDVNGDTAITILDALSTAQHDVGMPVVFTCP